MPNDTATRERLLDGAEALFRKQGYAASGLTAILEVSAGPKGSFYFYFPGGKRQLAGEVLDRYGARGESAIRALAQKHAGEPAKFVRTLFRAAAKEMEATEWTKSCLAQNFANELAPADSEMADQLAGIFARWRAAIAEGLSTENASRKTAEQRATAILAALEGARTLARAMRSAAPFEAIVGVEWF